MPEDENDLAYFLRNLQPEIPMAVIGAGSNLIVRDGGVPGVVIRLGRGFNDVKVEADRVTAGTAMLDVMVARAAQTAGIAGLGISQRHPGTIGGARAHERRRVWWRDQGRFCRSARRRPAGNMRSFSSGDMGFSYRHCSGTRRRDIHLGRFSGPCGNA
jgi:UDP-N-acetylmuramate dehydrogenase